MQAAVTHVTLNSRINNEHACMMLHNTGIASNMKRFISTKILKSSKTVFVNFLTFLLTAIKFCDISRFSRFSRLMVALITAIGIVLPDNLFRVSPSLMDTLHCLLHSILHCFRHLLRHLAVVFFFFVSAYCLPNDPPEQSAILHAAKYVHYITLPAVIPYHYSKDSSAPPPYQVVI